MSSDKALQENRYNLVVTLLARTAHEANRVYCEALGDHSQVPWEQAPDWQKDSCREGVKRIMRGGQETLNESASKSHEAWLAGKKADGWTYGPVKDVEKKEHPCFVEWEQLPESQREKDILFQQFVGRQLRAISDHVRWARVVPGVVPTWGRLYRGVMVRPDFDSPGYYEFSDPRAKAPFCVVDAETVEDAVSNFLKDDPRDCDIWYDPDHYGDVVLFGPDGKTLGSWSKKAILL